MKRLQTLKKQAGLTLMELIASLSIAAIIIIGALALYNSASRSQQTTQMLQDVSSLRTIVKSLYQGSYGAANTVLDAAIVGTGRLPATLRADANNVITNTTGQTVTIKAGTNAGQFVITVGAIEPDVCIGVLTSIQGWVNVATSANAAGRTAFPISLANATTDCGTAPGNMVFTGN